MADVTLRVKSEADTGPLGEVSGATEHLGEVVHNTSTSMHVFKEIVAELAKEGLRELVNVAKESVAAFVESDRQQRQLRAVAGDLTDAFREQAEVLKNKLAVDDDVIMQIQTMALAYGAAPSQVEALTVAVLDYSARTGNDAVDATRRLLIGVENGGAGLKKMGAGFEDTGTKSGNLTAAITALESHVGGAAETDAQGLGGRVRMLDIHMEDLKKSFGAFIATVDSNLGVLQKASTLLEGLNFTFGGGFEALEKKRAATEKATWALGEFKKVESEVMNEEANVAFYAAGKQDELAEQARRNLKMLREDLEKWRAEAGLSAKEGLGQGVTLPTKGAGDDESAGAKKAREKAAKDAAERAKQLEALLWAQEDRDKKAIKEAEDFDLAQEAITNKTLQRDQEYAAKAYETWDYAEKKAKEAKEQELKDLAALWDAVAAADKKGAADRKRTLDEEARRTAERTEQWKQAGAAVGMAFVYAMDDAMNGASVGQVAEDVLPAIASTILSLFPQTAAFASLGGAATKLGVHGVRAASGDLNRRHSGGWMDDSLPRYHSGAWPGLGENEVPAILTRDERVLGPQEIARMGGPAAVDRAARGGSSMNVTVQAIDAESFSSYLGGKGGSGLVRTAQQGRGEMAQMLSRMRRGWAT